LSGKLPSLAQQIPHPIGENIILVAQGFLHEGTGASQSKNPPRAACGLRFSRVRYRARLRKAADNLSSSDVGYGTNALKDDAWEYRRRKSTVEPNYRSSSISFFMRSDLCLVEFVRVKRFLVFVIEMVNQVIRRWRRRNIWFNRYPFLLEPCLVLSFPFTISANMPGMALPAEFLVRPMTTANPAVVTLPFLLPGHRFSLL
jgi:hypothetical protein